MIPGLHGVLAAPVYLKPTRIHELFVNTSFNEEELTVVQTINVEHAVITVRRTQAAAMMKVDETITEALRNETQLTLN
jgi:hypothetical protein